MDKEARPVQKNGNDGNRHNKHHRRKPYYIKRNDVDGESLKTSETEAKKAIESADKQNGQPSGNKQNEQNPQKEGGKNHKRDRHRGRRNRGDRRDREQNENQGQTVAETEEIASADEKNVAFAPETEADLTPEVIVAIEDEIVPVADDTPRVRVTGVRFKPGGKVYYFDPGELKIKNNSYVIVDTARGLEFGEVAFGEKEVKETTLVLPLRKVIRIATKEDAERNAANKKMEAEAIDICREKIAKHGLDMKLIEAQYSFDNSKLLFYFTSANRVDFRELVKDLAGVFKTRIELRQIGIRDEAKIMGGLGACGRPLCCASFLSDFVQVSIKMAKEQNLSLNSGKISGCCGRLMCCLQYEYQTYREEGAKTPSVDSTVKTRDGVGVVTESNALAGTIKVKLKDKPDSPPALYKREDVTVISRAKRDDSDEDEKSEK